MTIFDKREKAFEAQLAHNEELRFKAIVRRNKRLGLWAAQKLGKSSSDAETYSNELMSAAVGQDGDEAVFSRIRADFDSAEVPLSDHQIRRHMEEAMALALKEVMKSGA